MRWTHRENLRVAGQCQTYKHPPKLGLSEASYLLTCGSRDTPVSSRCTPSPLFKN